MAYMKEQNTIIYLLPLLYEVSRNLIMKMFLSLVVPSTVTPYCRWFTASSSANRDTMQLGKSGYCKSKLFGESRIIKSRLASKSTSSFETCSIQGRIFKLIY